MPRREKGGWLRQKRHPSAQPLPRIIGQSNYKQQRQILWCLSSEENPLSNMWDSTPLYVQDLDDLPWSFPHKLLRLEFSGLKGKYRQWGVVTNR